MRLDWTPSREHRNEFTHLAADAGGRWSVDDDHRVWREPGAARRRTRSSY